MTFLRHKIGLSHVELGDESCNNHDYGQMTCDKWVGFVDSNWNGLG
jgi:hypothetical protein